MAAIARTKSSERESTGARTTRARVKGGKLGRHPSAHVDDRRAAPLVVVDVDLFASYGAAAAAEDEQRPAAGSDDGRRRLAAITTKGAGESAPLAKKARKFGPRLARRSRPQLSALVAAKVSACDVSSRRRLKVISAATARAR